MLLAKDDEGYANLCRLVSTAHMARPDTEDPHVDYAKLTELGEGLIALTAGGEEVATALVGSVVAIAMARASDREEGLWLSATIDPDRQQIDGRAESFTQSLTLCNTWYCQSA